MKRIYLYILIALPIFALQSCKDDFLEIRPKASVATSAYYNKMAHADEAVTAAYAMFNTITAWDRDLLMVFGNIASDDAEAGGEFVNEVPAFEAVNWMVHRNTQEEFATVYGVLFRGIYFSNVAIQYIPGIAQLDPDANPALLDIRVAEAKFVRAISYFYLSIMFGGLPKVEKIVGAEEYQLERSSIKDIYRLIEKDLLDAIKVLPERSQWGSSNIGRATKGAAKALLSRVYLFESSYAKNYPNDYRFEGMEQRWKDALDLAEEVMESEEYKLVGIDGETYNTWRGPNTNGFRYVFTVAGDNSPESVFDIQCIQEGQGYGLARGTSLSHWMGARRCTTFLDGGGRGSSNTDYWGLSIPTQDLASAFEVGDPRFKSTLAGPGDSVIITGNRIEPICFSMSITNLYCNKFEATASEYLSAAGTWHGSPFNVRLIRFSEVYLNAAEAAFMLEDNGKALLYINKVRTRARNCGTTGVPADHTSIDFEKIVNERRVELALEGHRYFDLVRWNLAKDKVTRISTDGTSVEWEYPKHVFYPLPQREVDVTKGSLVQYEGW